MEKILGWLWQASQAYDIAYSVNFRTKIKNAWTSKEEKFLRYCNIEILFHSTVLGSKIHVRGVQSFQNPSETNQIIVPDYISLIQCYAMALDKCWELWRMFLEEIDNIGLSHRAVGEDEML